MTLLVSVVFQLNVIRNSCYCGSALDFFCCYNVVFRSGPHHSVLNIFSEINCRLSEAEYFREFRFWILVLLCCN
ncbi:unnamed protein product [Ectocarpus sp. 8 AP-2014]